ncbi:MAG: hypothetical protein ACRC1P_03430 [Cellulosilyticaceae bacterium]
MDLKKFIAQMSAGAVVQSGSELHNYMSKLSQEAMKLTYQLNNSYHEVDEVIQIFSELTGKQIDESFRMFPPFYTDCGKTFP